MTEQANGIDIEVARKRVMDRLTGEEVERMKREEEEAEERARQEAAKKAHEAEAKRIASEIEARSRELSTKAETAASVACELLTALAEVGREAKAIGALRARANVGRVDHIPPAMWPENVARASFKRALATVASRSRTDVRPAEFIPTLTGWLDFDVWVLKQV